MSPQEEVIFARIAGYRPNDVVVTRSEREGFEGTRVTVVGPWHRSDFDFFFPDYANMSDAEMAEVVANNLREEKWNSLRP